MLKTPGHQILYTFSSFRHNQSAMALKQHSLDVSPMLDANEDVSLRIINCTPVAKEYVKHHQEQWQTLCSKAKPLHNL